MTKQKKLPNGQVISVGAIVKGKIQKGYNKTVSGRFKLKSFGKNGENSVTLEKVSGNTEFEMTLSDLSTHLDRDFLERES